MLKCNCLLTADLAYLDRPCRKFFLKLTDQSERRLLGCTALVDKDFEHDHAHIVSGAAFRICNPAHRPAYREVLDGSAPGFLLSAIHGPLRSF